MNFAIVDGTVGAPQANFTSVVDTTARCKTGLLLTGIDNYWGTGEFIYGKATATIQAMGLCTYIPVLVSGALETQMTECASTVNQSRPVCVAMQSMTVGQFGWFAVSGVIPVSATASVAAGVAVGIGTSAGQIGTVVAGKAIFGMVSALASATTVVKANCSGISGQFTINIPDGEGWFVGVVLTGTGIGASSKVVSISPDQKVATVSVANSAAVTGSVTATYTNFNVVAMSRPTTTNITV